MSKTPLRYEMADRGLRIGLLASFIYAGLNSDGEWVNFAKQLVSKPILPIIPYCIAAFYGLGVLVDGVGGLINSLMQKKSNKNLEKKLE